MQIGDRLEALAFDRSAADALEASTAKEAATVRQLKEKVDDLSSGLASKSLSQLPESTSRNIIDSNLNSPYSKVL